MIEYKNKYFAGERILYGLTGRTAKNPYAIIANRLTNWNGKTVNNQELSA